MAASDVSTENTATETKDNEKQTLAERAVFFFLKSVIAVLVFVFTACALWFAMLIYIEFAVGWDAVLTLARTGGNTDDTLGRSIIFFSVIPVSALAAYLCAFRWTKNWR